MDMETATPLLIKHMLHPRPPAIVHRIEQIFRIRRRDLPTLQHQLLEIGREALVRASLERLHGRHDGQRALQQMRRRILKHEAEVAGQDSGFRLPIIRPDDIGREIAQVFDEHLLRQRHQAENRLDFVVRLGPSDVLIAAVEPIDKELERGVVVVGQVEFLRRGFGEGALERGLEVVGAVAQQGLVDAEGLALGADEDVDRVRGQQAKNIKAR